MRTCSFPEKHLSLIVICLILLVSVSATMSARAADGLLSGEEILSKIVGNTVSGHEDGERYSEYYRSDGRIRGNGYFGEWEIKGDLFCVNYRGSTDSDGCWNIKLQGNRVEWLKNGQPDGTSTLKKGNPNGL